MCSIHDFYPALMYETLNLTTECYNTARSISEPQTGASAHSNHAELARRHTNLHDLLVGFVETVFQSTLGRLHEKGRKKKEMIDEKKTQRHNPQLLQAQKALVLLSSKLVAVRFLILELYPFDLFNEHVYSYIGKGVVVLWGPQGITVSPPGHTISDAPPPTPLLSPPPRSQITSHEEL